MFPVGVVVGGEATTCMMANCGESSWLAEWLLGWLEVEEDDLVPQKMEEGEG